MVQCVTTSAKLGITSGIKLPYGEAPNGRLLHISEVPSGLACGCFCPECHENLVARKGESVAHHFAHRSNSSCAGAYETMLHKLAKQIVAERKCIMVPPRKAEHAGVIEEIAPAKLFRVDEVYLEKWRDGVKPDIIGRRTLDGISHELLIEVYVTHRCDSRKIAFLRDQKIPSMEIDLSRLDRDATPEQIEDQVLRSADRVWLYNGQIDRAQEELRHKLERQEAKAREQNLRQKREADALIRARARRALSTLQTAARASPQRPAGGASLAYLTRIRDANLNSHVGIDVKGAQCFDIEPGAWQAVMLGHFVIDAHGWSAFTTSKAFNLVKSFVRTGLPFTIAPDVANCARAANPKYGTPYEAVESYLEYLRGAGLLKRSGDCWHPRNEAAEKARAFLRKVLEGQVRVAELQEQVETLLVRLRAGSDISADVWMDTPLPHKKMTPRQLAMSDVWEARDITAHVGRLAAMLIPGAPAEQELLGFPLEEQHRARSEEWALAQEQKRLIEAERARAEAERERELAIARKQKIVNYAENWLGVVEAERWLKKPLSDFESLSLTSVEGLTQAQYEIAWDSVRTEYQRLTVEGDRRAKIERSQHELRIEAIGRLGDEHAEYWMKAPSKTLNGLRPIDLCVNQDGLNLCRAVLHQVPIRHHRK